MSKKNVLLLCHGYDSPFLSVALQYKEFFQNSPFKVITVFLKGDQQAEIEDRIEDDVYFLNLTVKERLGLKMKAIFTIQELDRKYSFEFCIAHRYKAIYVACHLNIPVMGICHIDSVFKRYLRRLFIYKHKNVSLCGVSMAIRDDIKKCLPKFPDERISFLYNSLNFEAIRSEFLSREDSRKALGLDPDKFIFANIGRLHEDKDQDTLIRGFAMAKDTMPNAQLVIAGTGRLKRELEDLIKELDIQERVILLGHVKDAYKYLKAFDSFVLSSIREGLPVALLEAFAAELPCCVSRCNGSKEAIKGIGFSFEVGDEEELSENLLKIYSLNSFEKQTLVTEMNKKIERNFTIQAVTRDFWNLPFIKHFIST